MIKRDFYRNLKNNDGVGFKRCKLAKKEVNSAV